MKRGWKTCGLVAGSALLLGAFLTAPLAWGQKAPELRYLTILGGFGLGNKAGMTDGKADLSKSYLVSGSLGTRYDLGRHGAVRTEIGASYQPFKQVGLRTDLYSVMVNAWYEFETDGRVRPYIGGGVGMGLADNGGFTQDIGFAYQVGGGIEADIFDDGNAYLGAGYRYYGFETETSGQSVDLSGHQLLVYMGFRF